VRCDDVDVREVSGMLLSSDGASHTEDGGPESIGEGIDTDADEAEEISSESGVATSEDSSVLEIGTRDSRCGSELLRVENESDETSETDGELIGAETVEGGSSG
jgi:hypothetical protein